MKEWVGGRRRVGELRAECLHALHCHRLEKGWKGEEERVGKGGESAYMPLVLPMEKGGKAGEDVPSPTASGLGGGEGRGECLHASSATDGNGRDGRRKGGDEGGDEGRGWERRGGCLLLAIFKGGRVDHPPIADFTRSGLRGVDRTGTREGAGRGEERRGKDGRGGEEERGDEGMGKDGRGGERRRGETRGDERQGEHSGRLLSPARLQMKKNPPAPQVACVAQRRERAVRCLAARRAALLPSAASLSPS